MHVYVLGDDDDLPAAYMSLRGLSCDGLIIPCKIIEYYERSYFVFYDQPRTNLALYCKENLSFGRCIDKFILLKITRSLA